MTLFLLLACDTGSPAASPPVAPTTPAEAGGAEPSMAPDTVLATWKGGQLTWGDVQPQVKSQLVQARIEYLQGIYETRHQALQHMAAQKVLEAEAAAGGKSVEELLKAEVEDKVAAPTSDEVAAFYPQVRRRFRNAPLEQVRAQVSSMLTQKRRAERAQAYVEQLQDSYQLELHLPYPELPRLEVSADDDPAIGPQGAPVTLIEFGDYQCPYCGRAHATVQEVLDTYGDQVRYVYRDFPLPMHPRATPAAVAANCAGHQDHYWEMNHWIFEHQRSIEDSDLEGRAREIGLDLDKWKACLASTEERDEIQADVEAGRALGVTGTPAFFVNGIFLNGARPFEDFQAVIDRELGKG